MVRVIEASVRKGKLENVEALAGQVCVCVSICACAYVRHATLWSPSGATRLPLWNPALPPGLSTYGSQSSQRIPVQR